MRRKAVVALLAVILSLVLAAPALAAGPTHMTIPFVDIVEDPSLNEPVQITGELYGVVSQHTDGSGGVHGLMHFTSRGLKGTGLTTGASYKVVALYTSTASGVLDDENNPGEGRWENTVVQHTLIVGPGRGNRYVLHSVYHITYNANGDLVVTVE